MAESNYSEMFRRHESQVDMGRCRNFGDVKLTLASWMGSRWRETGGQLKLVDIECERLGIPTGLHKIRKVHAQIASARAIDDAQFSTTSLITTAPISLPIIIIIIVVIAVAAVAIVWARKHGYLRRKSQS